MLNLFETKMSFLASLEYSNFDLDLPPRKGALFLTCMSPDLNLCPLGAFHSPTKLS